MIQLLTFRAFTEVFAVNILIYGFGIGLGLILRHLNNHPGFLLAFPLLYIKGCYVQFAPVLKDHFLMVAAALSGGPCGNPFGHHFENLFFSSQNIRGESLKVVSDKGYVLFFFEGFPKLSFLFPKFLFSSNFAIRGSVRGV